ncbi:syntenin-1 [Agrilus planipennis]|uniref:Syntenin-1 n=1 Tax=Agrilus planipennis TaxID=224129 RepID=A0A1W4X1P6_AGRPL|nr:syntenin-1 [Agrilus planipennis]XP_018326246.1 syntenin-1 [Agrilus planipennis]
MSIYPSLEDMKVDQLHKAQNKFESLQNSAPQASAAPYPTSGINMPTPILDRGVYPELGNYMGLELTEAIIAENMPEYSLTLLQQTTQVVPAENKIGNLVAPLSAQSLGLQRAQVTHGIRELTLCKGADGKIGLRVTPINNGIFVCLVVAKSPAALAGLRFGDQILQINGKNLAGFTMDQVHDLLKKSPVNGISIVVRDRPFERTLTLHKDSTGHIGFLFKNGKIVSIVQDSSAARNGVLTDHHLLEVEGQNVVGMKDKNITKIIEEAGNIVTVTVVPSFIYEHMTKKMASSLLKGHMDHSIPTI